MKRRFVMLDAGSKLYALETDAVRRSKSLVKDFAVRLCKATNKCALIDRVVNDAPTLLDIQRRLYFAEMEYCDAAGGYYKIKADGMMMTIPASCVNDIVEI